MQITINCSKEQYHILLNILEKSFRAGLGQFGDALDVHTMSAANKHKITYAEIRYAVERACKEILIPELLPNSYYGISSAEVPVESKVSYEFWKLLRNDTPINYSGYPLPTVVVKDDE